MSALPTIQLEAMLLGWQRSHNGGSKIVLQVPDEDLVHFEKMTVKKGKIAGQRLACVFVEIGPDERPVPQPATVAEAQQQAEAAGAKKDPLGGLAKWAVMRCGDEDFCNWLREQFPDEWQEAGGFRGEVPRDKVAKGVICGLCGIVSRKELDTNEVARRIFDELIRHPYSEATRGR